MATTPTTIIVFTQDPVNLPINDLLLVMKKLFQYGAREIKASGDKIFLKLPYSPKAATLKQKFGLLLIKYFRTKLDKNVEFQVLERIVSKYRFNLLDEQLEDINRQSIQDRPGTSGLGGSGGDGKKRKLYLEPPVLQHVADEQEEEEDEEEEKKPTTQKARKPPAASTTTVTGGNDNDDDDTLLLSQKIF
ncbi:unnamed protein product [Acanthoscelides obtectus]|uniref:Uncharacterized protein n=1 Tax=Acanthoscelides obtectus TaxID=200917 RepID=A0A9P0PZL2_ACAOB|nr:unnamed protein product [Acanthoscelides obtectus]CAK1680567.1 hypothetical protein AOBTE_LOCUS32767 [Acanthoscelides obtectus]